MKYRFLSCTGKSVSVIALGCASYGGGFSAEQSFEFMDEYVSCGGNFFDTARVYGGAPGRSEKIIGRWLSGRHDRDALIIGTKGGHPEFHSMHQSRLDPVNLTFDFENSIENLVSYADIYWLHRDDESRHVGDILETLNGFYERGLARSFGVSNWSPARIKEANDYAAKHSLVGFSANQPQFSLAVKRAETDDTLRHMDSETYRFHVETKMPCVPFSPQARGYFVKLAKGESFLSDRQRIEFDPGKNSAILARLGALSEKTGLSAAVLSLSYLLYQPFDTYPIIGASSMEQLRESLSSADAELSEEDILSLRRIEY